MEGERELETAAPLGASVREENLVRLDGLGESSSTRERKQEQEQDGHGTHGDGESSGEGVLFNLWKC